MSVRHGAECRTPRRTAAESSPRSPEQVSPPLLLPIEWEALAKPLDTKRFDPDNSCSLGFLSGISPSPGAPPWAHMELSAGRAFLGNRRVLVVPVVVQNHRGADAGIQLPEEAAGQSMSMVWQWSRRRMTSLNVLQVGCLSFSRRERGSSGQGFSGAGGWS
jgi:hypothetical protein